MKSVEFNFLESFKKNFLEIKILLILIHFLRQMYFFLHIILRLYFFIF